MSEHADETAACPTCGPTNTERHPRRSEVVRCANCKEWLDPSPATHAALLDAVLNYADSLTRNHPMSPAWSIGSHLRRLVLSTAPGPRP